MEVVEGEGTAVASWRSQEHDNEGRNFEQLCDASFFSRPFGFDSFFFLLKNWRVSGWNSRCLPVTKDREGVLLGYSSRLGEETSYS